MAIGRMKTAYDARLVGQELINAAYELTVGMEMTQDRDPLRLLMALQGVGRDLIQWSEGKEDHEEVFIPVGRIAELDQTSAEFNEFIKKNR